MKGGEEVGGGEGKREEEGGEGAEVGGIREG